jgi:hypothetical protein
MGDSYRVALDATAVGAVGVRTGPAVEVSA